MNNIANWILAIIQIAVSLFTGIIGWMFKKELAQIDRIDNSQREFEKKVADEYAKKNDIISNAEILTEIKNLEVKVSDEYVKKVDYNLAQGEVMKKLDKIYDILIDRKDG